MRLNGRSTLLASALLPALLLPAAAGAKTKTKTFSSGNVDAPITEQTGITENALSSPIKVKTRGRVVDVNVAMRITIPDYRDLDIAVVGPNFYTAVLKDNSFLNDPKAADFGSGPPTCAGAKTVFDSQAPTPILQGAPPFAGRYAPVQSLNGLNGGRVAAKWRLEIFDGFSPSIDKTPGPLGVLNCWTLKIRYKPEPKRKKQG